MLSRPVWAALAAAVAFAVGCAVMVSVLDSPLRPVDYFLSGAAGTFFAMVALFLFTVRPSKWTNVFYKSRRAKPKRPRAGSTLGI